MLQSLRFRLPALFLAGIALAGLVATVIAVRLFQDYTRQTSLTDLRREARGITELYTAAAATLKAKQPSIPFARHTFERATGDRVYYVGLSVFPGRNTAPPLARRYLGREKYRALQAGKTVTFELVPPKLERTYLAVASPVRLPGGDKVFGGLVVATPKADLSKQLNTLLERLALAFLAGIAIAMGLAWYFSRRLTNPLVALSKAADEVARRRYDVDLPAGGSGEVGHLAGRFRDMAAQLREASELERNFLMTVSHELKTPLTAIRGHVAALLEGIAEDPSVRAISLEAIAGETVRLERLVGDILDLAKLEANRFTVRREEIDMERLVDRAYSAFDQEARRREIDYDRRVGAGATIVSDGDRVLQIITNLLSNAFRWTPDGGRIELALGAENGSVSVAVADTGPGINAAERERIFRPFWTGDGRGTGLGLAIARELALALGGRIELDSTPGKGSRFELLLPHQPG